MNNNFVYHERVSSNRTEALFLALLFLCFLLFLWRVMVGYPDALANIFF